LEGLVFIKIVVGMAGEGLGKKYREKSMQNLIHDQDLI